MPTAFQTIAPRRSRSQRDGIRSSCEAVAAFRSASYYVGLAILLVLMVLALVQAYRMWEEIHDVEEPDSPTDLLEAFEEAHAAGELDDEEFERVRRRLAGPHEPAEDEERAGLRTRPDHAIAETFPNSLRDG